MFEFHKRNENRFEFVHSEGVKFPKEAHYDIGTRPTTVVVLKDKLTGVHYMLVDSHRESTITPLLGEDGKPFIDRG